MKRFWSCFLIPILFITSCSSLAIFGYKDLGRHYFLWEEDHHRHSIVWNKDNDGSVGGLAIIDPNKDIIKFNYDSNFIIIKTIEYESLKPDIIEFWIIKKENPISLGKDWKKIIVKGPMDSITISNSLAKEKINLQVTEMSKIK